MGARFEDGRLITRRGDAFHERLLATSPIVLLRNLPAHLETARRRVCAHAAIIDPSRPSCSCLALREGFQPQWQFRGAKSIG